MIQGFEMQNESLVLAVETATRGGSVCLSRGNKLLGSKIGDPQHSHSNTLLADINQVLQESRVSLSDVDLFAAASGPGSFTGLRIGIASIKALAITLGKPCIGVPTLHAVARAGGSSATSVALLPAGRGEVFVQALSVTLDLSVVELDQAVHIPPDALERKYANRSEVRWCGEGTIAVREKIQMWAEACGYRLTETISDDRALDVQGWTVAPLDPMLAGQIAALALLRFMHGDSGDPKALRAIYVRPSDAELNSNVQPARSS